MKDSELIEDVKLALNPKVKNWVLFSNGTVVVVDSITQNENLKEIVLERMKKFGPVYAGSEAGDFGIVDIPSAKGWMVTGYGSGMYTYVHPLELKSTKPPDIEIGIYGRSKRHKDSEELKIIHIEDTTDKSDF